MILIMKVPKYLLNAAEVMTCRNGVETFHVKMVNGLISYRGQISNPELIVVHSSGLVLIEERHYFI